MLDQKKSANKNFMTKIVGSKEFYIQISLDQKNNLISWARVPHSGSKLSSILEIFKSKIKKFGSNFFWFNKNF